MRKGPAVFVFAVGLAFPAFAANVQGPVEVVYDLNGVISFLAVNIFYPQHGSEAVIITPEDVIFSLAGNGDFTTATKTAVLAAIRTKVLARQAALTAEKTARDAAEAANANRRRLINLPVRDQDIN